MDLDTDSLFLLTAKLDFSSVHKYLERGGYTFFQDLEMQRGSRGERGRAFDVDFLVVRAVVVVGEK